MDPWGSLRYGTPEDSESEDQDPRPYRSGKDQQRIQLLILPADHPNDEPPFPEAGEDSWFPCQQEHILTPHRADHTYDSLRPSSDTGEDSGNKKENNRKEIATQTMPEQASSIALGAQLVDFRQNPGFPTSCDSSHSTVCKPRGDGNVLPEQPGGARDEDITKAWKASMADSCSGQMTGNIVLPHPMMLTPFTQHQGETEWDPPFPPSSDAENLMEKMQVSRLRYVPYSAYP
jgi:hypothetical protein